MSDPGDARGPGPAPARGEGDDDGRDLVDLVGEGSFPASDPPSWWSGRDPRPRAGDDAPS